MQRVPTRVRNQVTNSYALRTLLLSKLCGYSVSSFSHSDFLVIVLSEFFFEMILGLTLFVHIPCVTAFSHSHEATLSQGRIVSDTDGVADGYEQIRVLGLT